MYNLLLISSYHISFYLIAWRQRKERKARHGGGGNVLRTTLKRRGISARISYLSAEKRHHLISYMLFLSLKLWRISTYIIVYHQENIIAAYLKYIIYQQRHAQWRKYMKKSVNAAYLISAYMKGKARKAKYHGPDGRSGDIAQRSYRHIISLFLNKAKRRRKEEYNKWNVYRRSGEEKADVWKRRRIPSYIIYLFEAHIIYLS